MSLQASVQLAAGLARAGCRCCCAGGELLGCSHTTRFLLHAAAHAAGAFTANEPGQESAGEGEEEEEDRADEEGLVLDAIKAIKLGGRAEPARPAAAVPRMALPGMVAAAASSAKPGGSGLPRLTARSGLRVSIVGKSGRVTLPGKSLLSRPAAAATAFACSRHCVASHWR